MYRSHSIDSHEFLQLNYLYRMTNYSGIVRCIFFVIAVMLLIGCEVSTARGGRGGGSRSGSRISSRGGSSWRTSRSRGGSRGGSSNQYKASWQEPLLNGKYYGSGTYLTRRRYKNGLAPRICQSSKFVGKNGSVDGKFVCPLGEQTDDYGFCCGPNGLQRCCRFQDDRERLIKLAVGVAVPLIIIGICVTFYCCWSQHQRRKIRKIMAGYPKCTIISCRNSAITSSKTYLEDESDRTSTTTKTSLEEDDEGDHNSATSDAKPPVQAIASVARASRSIGYRPGVTLDRVIRYSTPSYHHNHSYRPTVSSSWLDD